MGLYRNTSIWQDLKREFGQGNMVTRLIMINVGVFLAISLAHIVIFLTAGDRLTQAIRFSALVDVFAMPMEPSQLIYRPWTIFTYMFLHADFFHVLWNVLFLFWFGRILHQFVGNRKILPIYFYGGLAGAVLALVLYQLPQLQDLPGSAGTMLGASAGVMAIVVAAASIAPNYTVFLLLLGPVKLKYIALVLVILDIIAIPGLSNAGGHFAHLGGALLGYVFISRLQRGKDWSLGFNYFFDGITSMFSRRRPRVAYKKPRQERKAQKRSGRYSRNKQEQLDEILDKIAKSGYDNLSKEEKEFLFKVSKED